MNDRLAQYSLFLYLSDTKTWWDFLTYPSKHVCTLHSCLARGWDLPSFGKILKSSCEIEQNFISKNWVWKTCVSPLETGGFKVDRKQDWRVYVFIILSCITPQQQGKERKRMPAAVPKAKSLWVSDRTQRSKPGVLHLDLNTHLYTQQKRSDKPRKDRSLWKMEKENKE